MAASFLARSLQTAVESTWTHAELAGETGDLAVAARKCPVKVAPFEVLHRHRAVDAESVFRQTIP